ncbi:hypothetical protein D3C86_1957690 [compost metagenome]
MVVVNVSIAQRVDKVTDFQANNLCDHMHQQRIRGNVEGNAQEDIGRTLIQLASQLTIGHVELEHRVARG